MFADTSTSIVQLIDFFGSKNHPVFMRLRFQLAEIQYELNFLATNQNVWHSSIQGEEGNRLSLYEIDFEKRQRLTESLTEKFCI